MNETAVLALAAEERADTLHADVATPIRDAIQRAERELYARREALNHRRVIEAQELPADLPEWTRAILRSERKAAAETAATLLEATEDALRVLRRSLEVVTSYRGDFQKEKR